VSTEGFDNFTVCPACAGLVGYPPGRDRYPQVCHCHRAGEERWPDHDFNEYATLCWCCQIELIPSGSKWSAYYCRACLDLVRKYNQAAGRVLLPAGRHSIMNGLGLRGGATVRQDVLDAFAHELAGFVSGMQSFFESMGLWRPDRLRVVLGATGQEGSAESRAQTLPLADYLKAVKPLVGHPQFGKRSAFDALCGFLGYPPPPEGL
jgi:hypothetical protein